MERITITLETITPLFLYGANSRAAPELRSPPFRGLMRYWFRALAGGVVGDRALNIIHEKESSVFGSADDRYGQSSVWVRLSTPKFINKKHPLLPHKNRARFSAIPPGTAFTLTITLKPEADINKLEMAIWSLLVGLTLGGIGKRSRRGFGSLRIQTVNEKPDGLEDSLLQQLSEAEQLAANGKELAQRIGDLITAARKAFGIFLDNPTPMFNDPPLFSILRPDTHIAVWTRKDGLPEAYDESILAPLMSKLSAKMAELEKNGKGHFAEAFGGINIKLPGLRDTFRRASPLWVSTHRLQNNKWALVLTHLKAQYLPRRAGSQHHLVTEFLNSPPDGWSKTEVSL